MTRIRKAWQVLVAETREFHIFYFRSDRDQFIAMQNKLGNHILTGEYWIEE